MKTITESYVRKLVAEHMVLDEQQVQNNSNIFDLGADDLDEIEIIMTLEDKTEVELPDNDYHTVQDFIDALRKVGAIE